MILLEAAPEKRAIKIFFSSGQERANGNEKKAKTVSLQAGGGQTMHEKHGSSATDKYDFPDTPEERELKNAIVSAEIEGFVFSEKDIEAVRKLRDGKMTIKEVTASIAEGRL